MKHPVPARMFKAVQKFILLCQFFSVSAKAVPSDLQGLTRLLQRFLEVAPDSHSLAHRLHLKAKLSISTLELIKIPARHFYDHIVDCRFEIRCCGPGDGIIQLIEIITNSQFGCDLCD